MALCWVQVATWQQRSSALHIEMTSYPLAACWDFLPQVHPSELKEVQDNRGAEILILSVSQILCTRERDAQNYFFKLPRSLFLSRGGSCWCLCLQQPQRPQIPGKPPHSKERKQKVLGSSSLEESWLMLPISDMGRSIVTQLWGCALSLSLPWIVFISFSQTLCPICLALQICLLKNANNKFSLLSVRRQIYYSFSQL